MRFLHYPIVCHFIICTVQYNYQNECLKSWNDGTGYEPPISVIRNDHFTNRATDIYKLPINAFMITLKTKIKSIPLRTTIKREKEVSWPLLWTSHIVQIRSCTKNKGLVLERLFWRHGLLPNSTQSLVVMLNYIVKWPGVLLQAILLLLLQCSLQK